MEHLKEDRSSFYVSYKFQVLISLSYRSLIWLRKFSKISIIKIKIRRTCRSVQKCLLYMNVADHSISVQVNYINHRMRQNRTCLTYLQIDHNAVWREKYWSKNSNSNYWTVLILDTLLNISFKNNSPFIYMKVNVISIKG